MPATLFNLWNPYRALDGTLTFEVTQADTFRIDRGTRPFFDAALQALGIASAGAYSWDIIPGRSLYYSSYPTDDSWRDRWSRTWRIRIAFEVPPSVRPNALVTDSIALSNSDDSWEVDADDQDRYLHTAFVIADFKKPRDEVERIASAGLAGAGVAASLLEPAIRDLEGGIRQIQLIARDIDLATDIAALDALARSFKAVGGVVNWNSHPTWPDEPLTSKEAGWMATLDSLRNGK